MSSTRLYLRDAAPAYDPGDLELSTVLPVGIFGDGLLAVKGLSPYKGPAVTNVGLNSTASTSHQDNFFTSFSSPPLLAGKYGAGLWAFAVSCSESSAIANSFFAFSIYAYRPSTASVVGYIYDSDTALAGEWPLTQGGIGSTFTGSEVTVIDGDILVLEVWSHATQDKASAATKRIYYDGTVDVGNGDTETDAASWIQAPHEIGFKPRLRGVGVN